MSFPPAEAISDEQFRDALTTLGCLLSHLPEQVPHRDKGDSTFQEFLPPFVLDADYFEKTEDEIATLGEQLECAFGWKARTSDAGILPIQESGPAICAVHTVLEHYHHKYLGSTHPCAETKTLRP